MDVVSIRVDKELREKMRLLSYINWSEVIREAVARKILEEASKKRRLDPNLLLEAAKISDSIRRPSPGWDSTEEIRKWREQRK
jgi:hypothetical protein